MEKQPLSSYQNDPALKARFIGHVERHREQDSVYQGSYGVTVRGKWRGCAVACSLRSLDEIDCLPLSQENGDHERLAARLGIPLVLAYLEDRIFEGLRREEALTWPSRFAAAIPVGRDLTGVWAKLAHWMLVDEGAGVLRFASTDATRDSIRAVAALYSREIAGNKPTEEEWRSAARYAARYADAAAAASARYAARYASARYADAAASASAAAAASAADAARYADAAAARYDQYRLIGNKLLELMGAA